MEIVTSSVTHCLKGSYKCTRGDSTRRYCGGPEVYYWRERNCEVDFVLKRGEELVAIEVKNLVRKESLAGTEQFARNHPVRRKLAVGSGAMPVEEFLSLNPGELF